MHKQAESGAAQRFSLGGLFVYWCSGGACNRRAVGIGVKNDAGNMDELAITYDAVGAPQASNIDATEIADVVLTMRGHTGAGAKNQTANRLTMIMLR